MRKACIAAVLVVTVGGAATAIAQPDFNPPPDPSEVAAEQSSYGLCVAEAGQSGSENPAEACAALKPGGGSENSDAAGAARGGDGAIAARNGSSDQTFAAQCAGESKEDGSFGECVSELASSFGQCVAAVAKAGVDNPAAACADEFPGRGQPGNNGTAAGPPEGVTTGKPEGTPSGRPAETPSGKPAGTPAGRPESIPAPVPEGVPTGKPAGTPGGVPGF